MRQELLYVFGEAKYFDSPKFALKALKHNLKAKAVLAAGLKITYIDQINDEKIEWQFENGLVDYLMDELQDREILPNPAFVSSTKQTVRHVNLRFAGM